MSKQLIAEKLKVARKFLGKDQQEMATLCGKAHRSWQRYEQGEGFPTGEVFEALTDLGFNPGWFFTDDVPMLIKGEAQRAAEGGDDFEKRPKGLAQQLNEESIGAIPEKPPRGLAQRIAEDGPETATETPLQVAAHAHFDALNAVEGMGLLTKIYTSGDAVFIRAINANLLAFSDAIENRTRAETTINAIREMREQMNIMQGDLATLRQENQELQRKLLSRGDRDQQEAAG